MISAYTYPVYDDEELLLLDEEGVDLFNLGVEEGDELGRRDGADDGLELVVAQELVLPRREALLDLPLEPLAEFHGVQINQEITDYLLLN